MEGVIIVMYGESRTRSRVLICGENKLISMVARRPLFPLVRLSQRPQKVPYLEKVSPNPRSYGFWEKSLRQSLRELHAAEKYILRYEPKFKKILRLRRKLFRN
jgi:hypothetical protein